MQGRPDAPTAPEIVEVRSKTVVLSWDPPANNGAEITSYTVRSSQGDVHECGTTTCTIDGLTNNVTYTFTVIATNEVNDSDPRRRPPKPARTRSRTRRRRRRSTSATSRSRSPGSTRSTPTARRSRASTSGSPARGGTDQACVPGTSYEWTGLQNGGSYTFEIQAENLAPDASEWSGPSAPRSRRASRRLRRSRSLRARRSAPRRR
ncbi:fibronectin type III domain-containing protein [Oerskovia sp. M15]